MPCSRQRLMSSITPIESIPRSTRLASAGMSSDSNPMIAVTACRNWSGVSGAFSRFSGMSLSIGRSVLLRGILRQPLLVDLPQPGERKAADDLQLVGKLVPGHLSGPQRRPQRAERRRLADRLNVRAYPLSQVLVGNRDDG